MSIDDLGDEEQKILFETIEKFADMLQTAYDELKTISRIMQENKTMYEAERIEGFRKELAELINIYSLESIEDGNVPDHILADVMVNAMLSFNRSHKAVCKWHGVVLEPGNSRFADSESVEKWETPEQYQGRTGKPWPDNAAVYALVALLHGELLWEVMSYDTAKIAAVSSVCATEAGQPPDDWRPEDVNNG